ncbi:MAG TPA: serine hydrolase domain-containing protein [Gammaproteobacteria bacterium]
MTADALAELADPSALREWLAAGLDVGCGERVIVGVRAGGRVAIAAAGEQGVTDTACDAPMPIGCLAKLFTAALVMQARAAGRLGLDDPVAERLPSGAGIELRGITLRHLLEHTHGLDDSLLERAPRCEDGRIDARRLVAALAAAPRLAAPGEIYSYSNAGAWLLAAVLETAAGLAYARLLHDELLAPLGVAAGVRCSASGGGEICPAVGGALAVRVRGLLELVGAHAPCDGDAGAGTPLPGWHPLERGCRLGWKVHAPGWLGHQSAWPNASALVRVHPRAGVALAVCSTGPAAAVVAARVLGARLPELAALRVPRLLDVGSAEASAAKRGEGLYRTARYAVSVAAGAGGGLVLRTAARTGGRYRPAARASLCPAEHGVCFTRPALAEFPYVQLVSPCAAGYRFIWNGRFVLPRREDSARRA